MGPALEIADGMTLNNLMNVACSITLSVEDPQDGFASKVPSVRWKPPPHPFEDILRPSSGRTDSPSLPDF
jgi:hypothetical protein